MNEIIIDTCSLPVTISGAYEIASVPFIHADRNVDFDVLIYVTKGYICVTEDEQDYVIQKDELFFLKKRLHHYGKYEIPQGTAWYYIHFRSSDIWHLHDCQTFEFQNEPGNQGLVPQDNRYFLMLPKHSHIDSSGHLAQMIVQFIEYLNSTDPLRRWNLNSKLFSVLTECALSYSDNAPLATSLSNQISSFLTERVQEPFHAVSLEKKFHLSYKHMAALFKKETGTTIQGYHIQQKMNLACKLLRSTLLPIKDISLQLGYQDMLYFSRVFHAHIGCSPSAYRKRDSI